MAGGGVLPGIVRDFNAAYRSTGCQAELTKTRWPLARGLSAPSVLTDRCTIRTPGNDQGALGLGIRRPLSKAVLVDPQRQDFRFEC
jgi:hypothetical protein